jgi:hypothetical protein
MLTIFMLIRQNDPTPATFEEPNWACPNEFHLNYNPEKGLFSCCNKDGCIWEQR